MKIDNRLDLNQQLVELRKLLKASVIGQDEAINTIMASIERYQAGLHDGKRPIGSFLFLGPTGVGKTHLVESFAELTQPKSAFIKIDCAEFGQDHEVAKLWGAPPGYVGHGEGSFLTRKVAAMDNPENGFILLLDEIEKAHPKFFDTWLSVMDSGTMTDSKGKHIDFTKAMIFFTSNVGANHYMNQKDVGFRDSRPSTNATLFRVQEDVKKTFRPEFINRLSGTVYFELLTDEQQQMIFDRLIVDLNTRLYRHDVRIELGERLKEKIFKTGFSREYGAREIKRTIIKHIEHPLSKLLINKTVRKDSLLLADISDTGEFSITRIGDYPIAIDLVEEAAYTVG